MVEIREEISGMEPYPFPSIDSADVKLDQNESGYDIPLEIKKRFAAELEKLPLNRYPDSSYRKLRGLIAKREGCKPENVILGNGGDEILQMIALTFLSPKISAITLAPTFSVYRMVCAFVGCKLEEAPFGPEFTVPDGFAEQARGKAVFLCNPNSPTGTIIDEKVIGEIANNAKLVILDEAYAEFMEKTYPIRENVISLRTFSKFYSAAGLRVGYAIAPEKLINGMNRIRMPWNLNAMSMRLAEMLMENSGQFEKKAKKTIAERERIFLEFGSFAKTYPSGGNFLLAKSDMVTFDRLLALGVKVRKFSYLPDFIRITVGNEKENDILLESAKFIAGKFDCALFDMDGVLVDVSESYRSAIKKSVFEFSGKLVDDKDIEALKAIPGFNNDWDLSYALSKGIREPKKVDRQCADYAKIKEIFQGAYLGNEGVGGLREREKPIISKEALLSLREKFALGIVTSRPREEALWAMENMFPGIFDAKFLVAQEDCEQEKPSPAPILEAMRRVCSKKAFYVGDSGSDLAAANAAGIPCVYVGKERGGAMLWLKEMKNLEKVML